LGKELRREILLLLKTGGRSFRERKNLNEVKEGPAREPEHWFLKKREGPGHFLESGKMRLGGGGGRKRRESWGTATGSTATPS